jgi:hypothetical protein
LAAGDNKNHLKKLKGLRMAAIREENRRIGFGTSVAFVTSMEIGLSTIRIYFAAFGEANAAITPPTVLISS